MRTGTVEVHEGELLGPIDWNYDFRQHFNLYCGDDGSLGDENCEKTKALLREIDTEPNARWEVEFNYLFLHELIAVGMYDGWPYWKPTPAVLTTGPIGPEWHFFYDITGVRKKTNP